MEKNSRQIAKELKDLRSEVKRLRKIEDEKLRADKARQRQENFFLSVFTSIQDGISVLDKDMRIVLVNPTMEEWYKHAMPLVGKKCYEAYHSRHSPCEVCPTRRTLKEGGAAHEIVPRRGALGVENGWLDLFSYPLLDAKTKKVIGVIEYVRDITARKLTEDKLEEAAKRLFNIVERVDEGITLSDAKGYFAVYNSKMGDITGYTMQEANSCENFLGLLYKNPEERRKALSRIEEVELIREVRDVESVIAAKDGTQKTLLISTTMLGHRPDHMFLSVYRDVSHYKKIDELKDEFIGTVSHELRTPLSIVKEGINIIMDEIPGKINEEQAKVLVSAKNNIERLTRIINELLDISKIESGTIELKRTLLNAGDLIEQVTLSFNSKAREKGLALTLKLPPRVMMVYADEGIFTQLLANLLENAIKFTPKGEITVSARVTPKGLECVISDTGIGISKENMGKVFDKFQQFSRERGSGERGTGLGLSIAKKMVEMHGGRIWIESEPGQGTKVTFTLSKTE